MDLEDPARAIGPRRIAHLDMDAFYVSVELQRRPELVGLPVVVAGRGPRAVVTTASYEARRFGVRSAIPAARARRLCPRAVFVEPDFETYRARSREVMGIVRERVTRVEVAGLDEAYLDVTDIERPLAALRSLKEVIREGTNLGCSIGLGPSKLVAKIASDAEKPDGFVVLSLEQARARFAGASPRLVPGIGPKTAARLARLGIKTVEALAALSDEPLAEWFGDRWGPWLGRMARFEDDRAVVTERPTKSASRETTFDLDLEGLEALEPVLEELAADLCEGLVGEGLRGRTISIKIRLDDFSTHTRARTLPVPTCDARVVTEVALDLLRRFAPARPVRLLGVRLAGFEAAPEPPEPQEPREPQLELPPARVIERPWPG